MPNKEPSTEITKLTERHLKLGWWGLAGYIALGLALETMHGFKWELYLDVRNETRRLMWTLAHAHGALLSLVHIAWAASLATLGPRTAQPPRLITWGLTAGWLLVPIGFLLGGVWIYDGDPSLAILLVPIGAIVLLLAAVLAARYVAKV